MQNVARFESKCIHMVVKSLARSVVSCIELDTISDTEVFSRTCSLCVFNTAMSEV